MKTTKRLFAVLLAVVMLCVGVPFAAAAADEPTDWIEIFSFEDLDDVRYDLTANYKLMNDIDMTEWVKPGGDYDYYGQGWNPIGSKNIYASDAFTGVFDGNGHTISGMRMNVTKFPSGTGSEVFFGLFAAVSGTVRNLTVVGSVTVSDVRRNNYVGGIVARLNSTGLIENCTNMVKLVVTGRDGTNKSFSNYVGGIAGYGQQGTVQNCRNIASIFTTTDDYYQSYYYHSYVSGIIGFSSSASVFRCMNSGNIKSINSVSNYNNIVIDYVSGIAGCGSVIIENCYNYGEITSNSQKNAGIFYADNSTSISNCYNIGMVSGGNNNYAISNNSSTNCFYLKGSGITSTGAVEKSAAQLKRQNQFTGWDFDTVWTMDGRDDYFYPELRDVALLTPEDLKTPIGGVLTIDGEDAADATLTANVSGVTPAGATISYSWALDGTVVSTAKTYKLTTEDLGKTLVLTVTGTGEYKGELTLTRVLGEAHQHTEEIIPGTPATCTQDGLTDGVKCAECGQILTPQEVIPAKGHTEVVSPAVPATCLEPGSTEGRVCSECGEVIALQTEIPALGHSEQTHHTDAACNQVGYDITFCTRCGETLSQTILPPTDHTWDDGVVTDEATCTAQGTVTYTCTVCGATKTEPTDMLDHQWSDGEVTKEPSCTEAGEMTYTCLVGGETRTEPIDKLDHNLVLVPGYAATCTDEGLTDGWQCASCGKWILEQQPIDALGHTPTTDPAVAPTCIETGLTEGSHCAVCGLVFTEQEVVEKAAHTPGEAWVAEETEPTCTEPGSRVMVVSCSFCGEELSRQEETIDALGHTPGEAWVADEEYPSCTEPGSRVMVVECTVCGEELSREEETIDALGHDLQIHAGQDPTCTEDGWNAYVTCSRCDYSTYEALYAQGHTVGDAVIENIQGATCSNPGSYDEVYYCTVCGEEVGRWTVEGETLPHTPGETVIENEVAATCTAKGSYDEVVYCTVCGEEISREMIRTDKLDHNLVLVPGCAATCTETGLTDGWKCESCGKWFAEQKTIDKLAHTPGEVIRENEVAATCKAEGSYDEVIRCTKCNEELSRETKTLDKLAHTPGEAVRENEVAATCKAEGSYDKVIRCTECNEELSRETKTLDKLVHTPGEAVRENEVAATYDVGGSYDEVVYCSVCHDELSRKTVATDPLTHTHNYVAETTIEATCSVDGEEVYTCSICGDSYKKPIPATGDHVDEGNDGYCDACGQQMTGGDHCKYCGQIHGGAFGWLTKFFHSILAIFKR